MNNIDDFNSVMDRLRRFEYFIHSDFGSFKRNFIRNLYELCAYRKIKTNIKEEHLQNTDITECCIVLNKPIYIYLPNIGLNQKFNDEYLRTAKIFFFTEKESSAKPVVTLDFYTNQKGARFIQINQGYSNSNGTEIFGYRESDVTTTLLMPLIQHLDNATKEWSSDLDFQKVKSLLEDFPPVIANTTI